MAAETNSRTTLRFGVRGDGGGDEAVRSLADERSGTTRLEVPRNMVSPGELRSISCFSKIRDS